MDILEGLTPAQIEAVTHIDGPLLVLAGAGSGKTRVITRRCAHLIEQGVPPRAVLAITFTNKAAGEMRGRVEALMPGVRRPLVATFHSFCARMLREYAALLGMDPSFTIYGMADQRAAVRRVLEELSLDAARYTPDKVLDSISRAKNRLQSAADYAASPRTDEWARHLAALYRGYEAVLAESHALDFDDLLMCMALGLRQGGEFTRQLHERFHYILIDEYQDTNHAQYVLARDLAGPRRNLCATGDPDQSIYGWRGAELSNILDFEDDFPDARVVRLERNYRSTKTILAAADNVIRHNLRRKPKALFTENEAGPPIAIVRTDDEEAEADTVARRIASLHREGLAYRDIAVFVRTTAQTRALEDGLRRARPSIPYEVVRGTGFYERKEVQDILAYLRVLQNPHDDISLRRIINTPARGIGDKTVDLLSNWAAGQGITVLDALPHVADIPDLPTRSAGAIVRFRELMDGLFALPRERMKDILTEVIEATRYAAGLTGDDARERRENLDQLISLGAKFDAEAAAGPDDDTVPRGLQGFLQTVSLTSDQDAYDETADRVPLMTLHAAKGLEFPAVFVTGCEDGLLPHARSRESAAELEEERRLFFVGMTRAERFLTMTFARRRRIRGASLTAIQSPFLAEIPQETYEFADEVSGTSPASWDEYDRGYRPPGPERVVRKQADAETGFAPGELVRHTTYGLGRVVSFAKQGGRRMVRIRFNTVGEKLLDPRYAKLDRVAPA